MNTPYPKIAKRRRHIFSDGSVLFIRPSLITPVFIRHAQVTRTTTGCAHVTSVPDGASFKYFFDGNWFERTYAREEDADYEHKRLVAYAGGDVMPPEMR